MTRQEATEFYRNHSTAVYNTALRIIRDSSEAEEIMQDTLMRYIQKGVRSATSAQAAGWLRTTCIRLSIDHLRRKKRSLEITDSLPLEDYEEECEVPETMDVIHIRDAMLKLPYPYSLILDLVLMEGMDYAGIARLTGQKETTLRSWYSRGRARLAKELKANKI